jgi:hypothetical protein
MRKYCKAYKLGDFRQFGGWSEKSEENEPELSDETICYLWDDFVVVRSPVQEKGVLFDTVTPEWREFCVTTLHFEIPEDLRYAYEQDEQQEQEKASA